MKPQLQAATVRKPQKGLAWLGVSCVLGLLSAFQDDDAAGVIERSPAVREQPGAPVARPGESAATAGEASVTSPQPSAEGLRWGERLLDLRVSRRIEAELPDLGTPRAPPRAPAAPQATVRCRGTVCSSATS
jgi:hypothetical protein